MRPGHLALVASVLVTSVFACAAPSAGDGGALPTAPADPAAASPAPAPSAPPDDEAPPADPTEPLATDADPDPDQGSTDAEIDQDMGLAEAAAEKPIPAIPAACSIHAKIVTYTPVGLAKILDAFDNDLSPCADYFMFLPALVADKTQPRGPVPVQNIHARTGRFFATAEVHWQTWKKVTNMTWYEKGVELRKRMAAAGYDVARGDTWALNELPSTVRYDAATRLAARNMIRGLYDGPPGSPKAQGIVFVIGFGQDAQNVSVLEQRTKDWLEDAAFWQDVKGRVKSWSQEAYANPALTCVASAAIGTRAEHVNEFAMHPFELAAAGGASTSAAKAFFDSTYDAVISGSWKQPLYGDTNISLDAMKKFVSTEIYAQRAFARDHLAPDGRVSLSFHDNVDGATPDQVRELAQRIAAAIHGAYGLDPRAVNACSPTGAYTWCTCELPNAAFTEIWKAFETY